MAEYDREVRPAEPARAGGDPEGIGASRHEGLERRPGAQAVRDHREILAGRKPAWPRPSQPSAPPANRTGLPDRLKAGVEALSGVSLDGVKVHYNSSKPATLGAAAFAQGSEIHVAPGQERHLPHEAWHLVQQAQGRVRPTVQLKGGVAASDDQGLEAEADRMGEEARRAGSGGGTAGSGHEPAMAGAVRLQQGRTTVQRKVSLRRGEIDESALDETRKTALKALQGKDEVYDFRDFAHLQRYLDDPNIPDEPTIVSGAVPGEKGMVLTRRPSLTRKDSLDRPVTIHGADIHARLRDRALTERQKIPKLGRQNVFTLDLTITYRLPDGSYKPFSYPLPTYNSGLTQYLGGHLHPDPAGSGGNRDPSSEAGAPLADDGGPKAEVATLAGVPPETASPTAMDESADEQLVGGPASSSAAASSATPASASASSEPPAPVDHPDIRAELEKLMPKLDVTLHAPKKGRELWSVANTTPYAHSETAAASDPYLEAQLDEALAAFKVKAAKDLEALESADKPVTGASASLAGDGSSGSNQVVIVHSALDADSYPNTVCKNACRPAIEHLRNILEQRLTGGLGDGGPDIRFGARHVLDTRTSSAEVFLGNKPQSDMLGQAAEDRMASAKGPGTNFELLVGGKVEEAKPSDPPAEEQKDEESHSHAASAIPFRRSGRSSAKATAKPKPSPMPPEAASSRSSAMPFSSASESSPGSVGPRRVKRGASVIEGGEEPSEAERAWNARHGASRRAEEPEYSTEHSSKKSRRQPAATEKDEAEPDEEGEDDGQ